MVRHAQPGSPVDPRAAGSIGIAATAAAIAVTGGEPARLAAGLWLLVPARAVASIPFVRAQIDRLRHGSCARAQSDAAQLAWVAIAAAAVLTDSRLFAGGVALAGLAVLQARWVRRPPIPAKGPRAAPAAARPRHRRGGSLGSAVVTISPPSDAT